MATLNGWQRVWIVVSVIWLCPVVLFFSVLGLPEIYNPPKLQQVFHTCPSKTLPDDVQDWYDKNERSKLKPDDWFFQNDVIPIEVWRPESDRSNVEVCTQNTILAFNPETKSVQLPVFARLAPYDTLQSGYSVDSAIREETQERIASSKAQRRNVILFGIGATVGVPGLLYAFGAAVAWIRRGFKQDRSPRHAANV
jgi:hypothetical protein